MIFVGKDVLIVGADLTSHRPILKEVPMKHPGFKKVAYKIAKQQGISRERASAILASSTRKASASAKAKNPNLKRVKGNANSR